MTRASILIVDPDAERRRLHANALKTLSLSSVIANDWHAAEDLAAAAIILADPTQLPALRREYSRVLVWIVCLPETADAAARAITDPAVSFITPGAELDYALALAALENLPPAHVSEGDNGYALRLAALGEEIARIARSITPETAPDVPDAPLTYDPAILRSTLKARRLRDSLFPEGTFADPTWDMLLDLAASRAEGRPVSVTSLAIAAAVPASTALRHLKAMADAGMVVRRPDPEDGRRIYIELTDDALARMRAWVAGAAKAV